LDGSQFTSLTTLTARGAAGEQAYGYMDGQPSAINRYRIKMTGVNNDVKYSSVVQVQLQKGNETVSLYPNPSTGGTVNLSLQNMPRGSYTVSLFNMAGQVVMSKAIRHNGGSTTEIIVTGEGMAPGAYTLQVKHSSGKVQVLKLRILD
jgi:hypothetical protein